jgi:predicted ATPase/DNA-binding CsgD family transcriptional regulator
VRSRGARLPSPATRLLGREQEVRAAREYLSGGEQRLVTLTGPPGTGKTRLALEVARKLAGDFADGPYFVDVSPVTDPERVLATIAEALDVHEIGRQSLLESIKGRFRDRQALIVLDNFEQVLEAAPHVAEILSGCPEVRVLATSRAPLRLRWEQELPVPPLRLPDLQRHEPAGSLKMVPSVALFIERARAHRPDFELSTENADAVAAICVRLDGLPLAIELAAARVRTMSPQALYERLDTRLDMLADGLRDLPERQRTLRGAIGWSYSLLSADDRSLFRRLSVFVGGFEEAAAAGVLRRSGPSEGDLSQGLARLVDQNLVEVDMLPAGVTRFRLLETLREYGLECLRAANELDTTRRAHAGYFADLERAAESGLETREQARWIERVEAEHANIVAALGWMVATNDGEAAASMVHGLWRFWWRWGRGHLTLGRILVRDVLAMPGLAGPTIPRAEALISGGLLAMWQGDYGEAEGLLTEAADISRARSAAGLLAYALAFLCRCARDQGSDGAAALGNAAVKLFRGQSDRWGLGVALHFLGLALLDERTAEAARHFEESAALFREMGSDWDVAMPTRGLGLTAFLQGDYPSARKLFEQSASLFRAHGDEWSLAMLSHDLGSVASSQGRVGEGAALLGESLRIWRQLGHERGMLTALAGLSGLAVASGRPFEGVRLLSAVGSIARAAGIAFEPTDLFALQRTQDLARTRISEEGFQTASTEGEMLTIQGAVAAGIEVEALISAQMAARGAAAELPLTRRELEVTSLLRLGMSNRQIAEKLFISEGTAGLHVKHILGKLGFSSRAQVAAWAVEKGLSDPS